MYESCEHVPLRVMMVFRSGNLGIVLISSVLKCLFCFLSIAVGKDK